MECKVRSVECVKRRVWWGAACGVWSEECGVGGVK